MPQLHSNPPPPPDGADPEGGLPFQQPSPTSSAAPAAWQGGDMPSESPTCQFDALFVLPVKNDPGVVEALRTLLREASSQTMAHMRDPGAAGSSLLPFHELGTVHYARLVLLEPEHGLGARLVFATDYDGPEGDAACSKSLAFERHLAELSKSPQLAVGLDRLFEHCEGYNGRASMGRFLARHAVRSRTAYVGAPGRSVKQIFWELELRRHIERELKQHKGKPPAKLREAIRSALAAQLGRLPGFPAQPDNAARMRRDERRLMLAGGALGLTTVAAALSGGPIGVGLLGTGVFGLGLTYVYFRWKEQTDPQFQIANDASALHALERAVDEENHFLQNPLTHLVELKPGLMRAALIRVVFAALQYRATLMYNKGKLGDIPSIHFARWALIAPRHVLFLSNFDSSWQSYLGDFIDKASAGLTAVWSNTIGYPRTTRLLRAGSRDAARFLAWTRAHQRPTALWYCAYPGLSIVNINDNTAIRRGLADPTSMDAQTWLFRLRGVDRPEVDAQHSEQQSVESTLALERVQGIILRGYGHMPEARYVMLRVTDGRAALQWLAGLELTNAEDGARARAKPEPLVNVAFTYAGLQQLGVDEAVCQSFAPAFVQGSHHPQRALINGDVGANAPASWTWGNDEHPVHVLLLVYAKTAVSVDVEVQKIVGSAQLHGLEPIVTLEGTTLPGRKEHFGFRDGIGQPIVRGVGGSGLEDDALPAGEFLLGHPDAYGNISHAPTSPRGFSFGHDGSYLVFRQLEQRVADFWRYCAAQDNAQDTNGAVRVASKLVGRWPSGASLVRHPEADPDDVRFQDENDFCYLENDEDNDRYGARCPFGSHVRRTNPRDWNLAGTREESMQLSNRHRIMRRGRPYGRPLAAGMKPGELLAAANGGGDAGGRGLQFLCFNANIDRQFEFVQQHWCNNPHFAGLDNVPDPLLGSVSPHAGSGKPAFSPQTDARSAAPESYSELPSFVRVLGSAYFFMPSIAAVKLLAQGLLAPQPAAASEQVPPDEALHIDRLLGAMRRKMVSDFSSGPMGRGTHAKMHGCLEARFRVEPDVAHKLFAGNPARKPSELGLFEAPHEYKAWVRFSNQRPNEPDQTSDLRAVAIKVRDVAGVKLLDGEEQSTMHDFIMISLDSFLAKNVEEFATFVEALVDNKRRILPFLISHPRTALQMLRVQRSRGTLLERTYFSAVPYALGQYAVKYALRPSQKAEPCKVSVKDRDYLRKDLKEQLAKRSFAFDFLVQVQRDPKTMPVEDATVVWDPAAAPFVKVATLELLAQDFDTPERNELGEQLSFNPWRCLPAHRPLGGLNRARRQIYRALARFRHDRNGVEMHKRSPH